MTMQVMTNLVFPLILAIVPILMGYIIWILQEQRKETREIKKLNYDEFSAIKQGLMELLLENIADNHERYVIKNEPLSIVAFNRIEGIYKAYKKLGGNGGADKMVSEIQGEHIDGGTQ